MMSYSFDLHYYRVVMIDVQHLLLLQVLGGHLWMVVAALLEGIALSFFVWGIEPIDCNIDCFINGISASSCLDRGQK